MGEMWRLFVALDLPAEIRTRLQTLQDNLKRQMSGRALRWVDPAGVHLTLKFLGDVEPARVESLQRALAAAAHIHGPLELATSDLGCFPNHHQPRVVWVGLTGQLDTLAALQVSVERQLKTLDFPPEGRAYHPHLTLARVRQDAPRRALDEVVAALAHASAAPSPPFTVSEVVLFRSELRPTGSVYSALARVPLAAC